MMTVDRYPLQWPRGRARTPSGKRRRSTFGRSREQRSNHGGSWRSKEPLSIADAIDRLHDELERLDARLPVISSNLELRLDGLPRSGQREPEDPGVAVYYQLGGKPYCLPCDTFDRVADNIAGIAAHIEATRAIERYGVASVAEMFAGFTALPAPGAARPWWVVLGVDESATVAEIEAAHRALIRRHHPDAGGTSEQAAEVNAARDAGLRARAAA